MTYHCAPILSWNRSYPFGFIHQSLSSCPHFTRGVTSSRVEDSRLCDRRSELPSNIIDCILDRLPIRDIVATSILSKEWMHKWRRVGNLVFDTEFVDHIISGLEEEPETINLTYSNIICKILLLHLGPIQKFVLHVPEFCDGLPVDLSSWLLFISQNEVKDLTVEAPYADLFRLPTYIFSCSQLQHLRLEACTLDLNVSQSFMGFNNLLSLDISGSLDGDDLTKLIFSCPLLERLSIYLVELAKVLVIDAPRLRELSAYCPTSESLQMKKVSVTKISIEFRAFGGLKELMNIVSSVPNVETCTLCSVDYAMELFPTRLPTTLHSLRSLTLLRVSLKSLRCISFLFCVISSSPNLQKLNIKILGRGLMENEAVKFLDTRIRKTQILSHLITVKMRGLEGNPMEIMFFKLILSCSPVLNTVYVTGRDQLNIAEVTLLSELLQCPRSSCQARVVYSRFPGDSSIFDF